jgi:large subunit ribosomal protein L30
MSKLTITQAKSSAGASRKQNETLKTLGLGKIGRSVERDDHPTVRGLVHAVDHLVRVDE